MTDLHPVKEETFDLKANTNVDPKGFLRAVDTYRETDFGLYMARGADHPNFGYLESWLLPELGLRANVFHYRDGVTEREDIYIDVVEISVEDGVWTTRDLYVDLIWNAGDGVEVVDIDELAAATSAGLISAEDAEKAIEATLAAVEGITRHNDNPTEWMKSQGIDINWAQEVNLIPSL
ncbi:hypothetical protein CMUST_05870 [Corynebacterium mustelae]|uniref:DUF402 domain-containing protein n=1 Tax=Corynebacterium mustelae TaxID=571915 RepID=A0A0G3GY88_9CORY|nr:DUF402 domain-containing protein [Corynebacterium mustelae]AKK05510.1 hypothetical protein CMUST_05870 [Corynebacterium mustelae]